MSFFTEVIYLARQEIFGEILADPHNENYAELFGALYDVIGFFNPVEPVQTFADLSIQHPKPVIGDASYVVNEKTIYRWNGKEWKYVLDFTVVDSVINDVNVAKDATELATDNANTAVVNAYQKIGEMDSLKDTLNADESIRQINEDNRTTAEAIRAQSESTRIGDESTRKTNESGRVTAETERSTAELARKTVEQSRVLAEDDRNTKETQRISAEGTRIDNENTRKSNEATRTQSESTRVSNESGRVLAESERVSAENIRKSAENIRIANENTRINNENERIQRMQELEDIDAVHLEGQINNLAGTGRTTETVKGNADAISVLNGIRVSIGTTEPTDSVLWLNMNL